MTENANRLSESDLVRTPEYWAKLEKHVRDDVAQRNIELTRAFGLEPSREFVKLVVTQGSGKDFPSVALTSARNIEVYFPIEYFEHMDEAARFMNLDFSFRGALTLGSIFPREDLSSHFNFIWSRWILLHEIGHVICGHLHATGTQQFLEFPVVDKRAGKAAGMPLALRRAMEVDADAWAARAMFWTYGTMSLKGYWDDLYHMKDAVTYAMQDLALIFWPLLLELDHVSPDAPTTHPSTFERIIVMQVFGFESYVKRVGEIGREHLSSFLAGSKRALEVLARLEGSMIHKERPGVDLVAHWKALTSVEMERRRLYPIEDDWLLRTPKAGA